MSDNSLIFRLISKGETKKIKEIINKDKKVLYTLGPNYENPIHYACFYGNKDIIQLFVDKDDKILNLLNSQDNTGYHILAKYNPKILIYFIRKYKPFDLHFINKKGHTILVTYILNNKLDKEILSGLKKVGFSLMKTSNINDISFILNKDYKLLDEVNKYFKFDVNKLHYNIPISFMSLFNNNLNILKILVKYKINLNLNDKRIDNLLSISIVRQNKEFVDYLIKNMSDFTFTDSYENSYFNLSIFNQLDLKYHVFFLKKIDNLNKQNIFGDTTLHMIFKFNLWDKVKDFIIKKEINLDIKNKDGKKPLFYYKGKNKIKNEFKNLIKKEKDNFKYINLPTPMHTPFAGYYWVALTSILYILEKYPQSGFPICRKFNNDLLDKNELGNSVQKHIVNEIDKDFYCLASGKILWENKDNYYISENLKKSIQNIQNKDIIFIDLAIYYDKGSHASIIIIDNRNKEIERFETYGTSGYDEEMDNTLKKYLKKLMFEITKKKYTYNTPLDYQNIFDFQGLSLEQFKYINECVGFCVAWMFWYLEHKLLNPNIKGKKLVEKLKNKLLEDDKTILNSIRSYANKLDKYMVKKLLSYKVKKDEIYFLQNNNTLIQHVYKNILDDLLKIQNIE